MKKQFLKDYIIFIVIICTLMGTGYAVTYFMKGATQIANSDEVAVDYQDLDNLMADIAEKQGQEIFNAIEVSDSEVEQIRESVGYDRELYILKFETGEKTLASDKYNVGETLTINNFNYVISEVSIADENSINSFIRQSIKERKFFNEVQDRAYKEYAKQVSTK